MRNLKNCSVSPFRQSGLSLTEMMVAVAVSLLLMAGLIQLVVSNKTTYNYQQNQTQTFESSRYSFHYLQDFLMRAGFRNNPHNPLDNAFPLGSLANDCGSWAFGQVVSGTTGEGVCIRYERAEDNANELDCTGAAIANTNAFVTRIYHDAVNDRLMCQAQGGTAVALVDNVADIDVTYGVEVANNTLGYVATPSDWTQVRSIRIDLLVASEQEVLETPQSYFFPVESSTATTATDRRAYRSSQRTIFIRNANSG